MTELPRKWTRTPLGNACAILDFKRIPINSKERQARISEKPDIELFPYYGATGQVDVIDGYLFEGEHVLLGEDGAPFLDPFRAKAYIVDGKFWVNNHAHILKAHGSNRYLSHYLNAVRYEDHVSGTTRPKLTKRALMSIPVALPPLNEQHRIVEGIEALFDEIDRGVESLRDAKRVIGLYRQSLLKSAFEGRLTAQWRAENPDKLESPDDLLARIREEREKRYRAALEIWERALAERKNGRENGRKPTKPKRFAGFDLLWASDDLPWPSVRVQALLGAPLVNGRSAKDRMGGFPVLRLTALKSGKIDLRESKEGDWSEEDAAPFLVKRDDIFISRGNGSKKLVGIGGRVLHEPTPVAFPDTMIRVRPDTSAVRPEYFLLAWNSRTVRQQIENAARTTAGIYKINQGHIRGFVLPLPSLAEQAEIVRILNERLEAVDTLVAEIDANLARADALRQSILKKAFSGGLVSQDPDDEPAHALLTRIRAGRGGDSTKKPRKRARRRASTPLPS